MDDRRSTEDDPARRRERPLVQFLDAKDARPVNPNTPEGEIRNMAAFAAGVHAVTPLRRTVAKIVVWLVLLGFALAIVVGVVSGARTL